MNTERRRWFRFSLRTLFLLMTVLGCWLGWNLRIVRERKAVMGELRRAGHAGSIMEFVVKLDNPDHFAVDLQRNRECQKVSTVRRLLGDESIVMIGLPNLNPQLIERVENAFPEAELTTFDCDYRDSLYMPESKRRPNRGSVFKTGLPLAE